MGGQVLGGLRRAWKVSLNIDARILVAGLAANTDNKH